jgi:hypothetical protein
MQTLDLINETQTDGRNGWLRILMQKDKCIYAGCRRVIKVNTIMKFLNEIYLLGI